MTQIDSAAARMTPVFGDTSDWEREFDNCLAFVWFAALLVILGVGNRVPAIPSVVSRPLFLAVEAMGLGDGWIVRWVIGAVLLLTAMTLASVVGAVVAGAMVAVKHGVCALVRSANRR